MELKLLYIFCLQVIYIAATAIERPEHPATDHPKEVIVEYSWIHGLPHNGLRDNLLYWIQQGNRIFDWLRRLDEEESSMPYSQHPQPATIIIEAPDWNRVCSKKRMEEVESQPENTLTKAQKIICWLKGFVDQANKNANAQNLDHKNSINIEAVKQKEQAAPKKEQTPALTIAKAKKILNYIKKFLKEKEDNEDVSSSNSQHHGVSSESENVPKRTERQMPRGTWHPISFDPNMFFPKHLASANRILYWLEDIVNTHKKAKSHFPSKHRRSDEYGEAFIDHPLHRKAHYADEEDSNPHVVEESFASMHNSHVVEESYGSRHNPHIVDDSYDSYHNPHTAEESYGSRHNPRIVDDSYDSHHNPHTVEESYGSRHNPHIVDDSYSHHNPHTVEASYDSLHNPHIGEDSYGSNKFSQNSYEDDDIQDSRNQYEDENLMENNMSAKEEVPYDFSKFRKHSRTDNDFVDQRFFTHLDHANRILYWLQQLIAQSKNIEKLERGPASMHPSTVDKIKKAIQELEILKKHLLASL